MVVVPMSTSFTNPTLASAMTGESVAGSDLSESRNPATANSVSVVTNAENPVVSLEPTPVSAGAAGNNFAKPAHSSCGLTAGVALNGAPAFLL